MRHKGLSLFLFFCLSVVAAADSSKSQPLDTTQLTAWLTGGISSTRLVQLIQERGLALAPTENEIHQLQAFGADEALVRTLAGVKPADSHSQRTSIPAALLQAAAGAHARRYHEAELQLRAALRIDPQNPAIHFALAAMFRQQEQWDDAYDELTISARLMPDFPDNHSSLAYVFYRLDDGPNAIAV